MVKHNGGSQSERDGGERAPKGGRRQRKEEREESPALFRFIPGLFGAGRAKREREREEGPKEVIADPKGKTTHVSDIASKKEDCSAYYLEREVSLAELLAGKAGPFPRKQRIL